MRTIHSLRMKVVATFLTFMFAGWQMLYSVCSDVNPNFSYNTIPSQFCKNPSIQFFAEETGNTYQWKFSDGSTSNIQNPLMNFKSGESIIAHLIVYNGCDTDSSEHTIPLYQEGQYTMGMNHGGGLPLRIKIEGQTEDGLTVCRGTKLVLSGSIMTDSIPTDVNLTFNWEMPDGTTAIAPKKEFTFNTLGENRIILNVASDCGVAGTTALTINVDNKASSKLDYEIFPWNRMICKGEKIYLHTESERKRDYTINWGEGTSSINVKGVNKYYNNGIIAFNPYNSVGKYALTVTSNTACGTSVRTDSIIVSSTSLPATYYIGKSDDEGGEGIEGVSFTRQLPTDMKLTIPVKLSQWKEGMDSTFYLKIFYGGAPKDNDFSNPDLEIPVKVKNLSDITTTQFVKLYLTIPVRTPSKKFGIVVGYNCDGSSENSTYWAYPQTNGSNVYSYQFAPGTELTIDALAITDVFDCVLNTPNIVQKWGRKIEKGKYRVIDLYSNDIYSYILGDSLGYNNYSQNDYSWNFSQTNDQITFTDDYAEYKVKKTFDGLKFDTITNDTNAIRKAILLGGIFKPWNGEDAKDNDKKGFCPGDTVEFQLYGGKSFSVNFGDSTAWITVTSPIVKKVYKNKGVYNFKASAISGCGKPDTIVRMVWVRDDRVIDAGFEMVNREANFSSLVQGETTWFRAYERGVTHSWSFSDDFSTLSGASVMHTWTKPGNYKVKHTITTGCGIQSQERQITVLPSGITSKCYVGISAIPNGDGSMLLKPVGFNDFTNYLWSFKDQNANEVTSS